MESKKDYTPTELQALRAEYKRVRSEHLRYVERATWCEFERWTDILLEYERLHPGAPLLQSIIDVHNSASKRHKQAVAACKAAGVWVPW